MMIYICVVCMAKQPPLLFLSAEQRQILEAILSPPLNTAELQTRQLLLCACCMAQLQSLLAFRQTALEGAQQLLKLYNLIEQNVAASAIQVSVKHEPVEHVQEHSPPIAKKLIPTEELDVKYEPASDDERAEATPYVPDVDSAEESAQTPTTTAQPTALSDVTVEILTHRTVPQTSLIHNNKTTRATKNVVPGSSSSNVQKSLKRKKTPSLDKSKDKTRVACKECNKTFSSNTNLKDHHSRAHVQSVPTMCDICNFVCKNEPAMKHHKKHVHKVKEPRTIDNLRLDLFCAECQIQCPSRAAFRDHMLSLKHTPRDKWSFECDMCQRRFPNRRRLQFHKDSVHLDKKKHKCDKCNNTYATRCGLRLHISTVHDKIPPRKIHTCHVCGDCFSTKAMLAGHINTHTGDRPYVCNLCGDTFGHKSALYLHGRFKHKIPRKKDIKKTEGSKIEGAKRIKKIKKTKDERSKDVCA